MQITLKFDYTSLIFFGLLLICLPVLKSKAQSVQPEPQENILSVHFKKNEITQKTGQLGFNTLLVHNLTDSNIRIKPIFTLPDKWARFSSLLYDTLVPAHDSLFLPLRFRIPSDASSESGYEISFKAYSIHNQLLAETSFQVFAEPFHDWDVVIPSERVFFYPGMESAHFEVLVSNKGNVREKIDLNIHPDLKIRMTDETAWKQGRQVVLAPFTDTVIRLDVAYAYQEDRIFDLCKLQIDAVANDDNLRRIIMIEKYSDIYAPMYIDRSLPHQAEAGVRTFTGNRDFLPFVKTRGFSTFKNKSTFLYNFNYYALAENEDIISNSYYNFLYHWQTLKVGLGAFSSQYGRNIYTRHGLMVSNVVNLTPNFAMEAFVSQSLLTPKTSAAVGYVFKIRKTDYNGSFAYDRDADRKVNTTSMLFQTGNIPLHKNHAINLNLYGYHEFHYQNKEYTLMGLAYDIRYSGRFGKALQLQITNNYGTPDMPGPQMGLFNFIAYTTYAIGDHRRYFSSRMVYSTRNYYNYSFDGDKLPENDLSNKYVNVLFHSNRSDDHKWEAGPSIEFYHSIRPSTEVEGSFADYYSQKLRFEYKGVIFKNLTINMKAGINDIRYRDNGDFYEQKYDFHVLGGYSMTGGYGLAFSYDYGPMVNSGLYQYAGDTRNHSITFGPTMMTSFWKERINFNLFTNFIYRFDLEYASLNINPKIEAYLFQDFYLVMSGTYHYSRQQYPDYSARNSYAYLEVSVKKRWGKSDYNKWQKDTRRLKLILFKDENANGIKDFEEQGVPFVKTRLRLTNSASENVSTQFPVDITLLSNEEGIVIYNRLPVGFYDLTIFPLGDVREYFYVDRGAEKLELTKTSVYYIPFQKATKLSGNITVKRQQFIKQGEETLDLANIRVTAYNTKGNSYSSFTLEDGSFTIYVPGENEYYVRMPNVFGDSYKIPNNDMLVYVSDTTESFVGFNVIESSRQIAFKKAKPEKPDTVKQALKIKVLHGKLYENQPQDTVDINAMPEFNIQFAPPDEQLMVAGNYYVVAGALMDRPEALKYQRILDENGVRSYLGLDEPSGRYWVFTNYYRSQESARKEMDRLKKAGLKDVKVMKY